MSDIHSIVEIDDTKRHELRTSIEEESHVLRTLSYKRRAAERHLFFLSGIMSVAGATLATLPFGSTARYIYSGMSFVSGMISLLTVTYFSSVDTRHIDQEITSLFGLIGQIDALTFGSSSRPDRLKQLRKISDSFANIKGQYNSYLPSDQKVDRIRKDWRKMQLQSRNYSQISRQSLDNSNSSH